MRKELHKVIQTLSHVHKSPPFEPHITLFSLPSDTPLPLSLGNISKFPIRYKAVQSGETFFQSVLITLEKTDDLCTLHDALRISLEYPLRDGESYFPHLSLYYGDVPMAHKERIVAELAYDGIVQGTPGQDLKVGGRDGFEVSEIWVVRTEGNPNDWPVLDRLILSNKDTPAKSVPVFVCAQDIEFTGQYPDRKDKPAAQECNTSCAPISSRTICSANEGRAGTHQQTEQMLRLI